MKKNKNVLGRMLNRKPVEMPVCPDICFEGKLYHQQWVNGACVRAGASIGPCPEPEIIVNAVPVSTKIEIGKNEPPLICWKGKLYRQKWVDGGLEAYGDPLGDC